jgi:CRISPR-associated exonuclease Cas4
MFDEDALLPISALQHLVFCERQWGLIHLEGLWDENRLTAEGRHLHERTHRAQAETRDGVRTARGLRLRSLRLGLTGIADVVEFHPLGPQEAAADGCALPGRPGRWRPFPVEYKRGRRKAGRCDEVQLCAQALCLEEMLDARVPAGAMFYGARRRRYDVRIDDGLRAETERAAARLHELSEAGRTPAARVTKACKNCSLQDVCLPRSTAGHSVRRYLALAVSRAAENADEEAPEHAVRDDGGGLPRA